MSCYGSACFYSSSGFHIPCFVTFQVCLLTCYFYFSTNADKFCFFLESLVSLCCLSKEAPIIKHFGFMANKIYHEIKNIFIKSLNLLIYTLFRKSSFLVELGYRPFDWIIIGNLIVPDNLPIWRGIEYFQVSLQMHYLIMNIRMK